MEKNNCQKTNIKDLSELILNNVPLSIIYLPDNPPWKKDQNSIIFPDLIRENPFYLPDPNQIPLINPYNYPNLPDTNNYGEIKS